MDPSSLAQSPFAVLTLIAAPAVLTNATSVLAMSTINRMLRTRDRMHDLYATAQNSDFTESEKNRMLAQVDRVECQAELLLRLRRPIVAAWIVAFKDRRGRTHCRRGIAAMF